VVGKKENMNAIGNKTMDNNPIIVSICMITYNHELYIRQAIEGVLMQQTNFPIELIIGEDCSTDHTREICIEYKEKYPEIIKLQLPDTNRGMHNNFIEVLKEAKGKYIAICEGDDYWTDTLKLQKQVDFLENHSDYGLLHTRFARYYQVKNEYSTMPLYSEVDATFEHLLQKNVIGTLSVLMKRDLCNAAMNEGIFHSGIAMGDYPLWLYIAKHSKIGYMNDCTSVYRVLDNSASHKTDPLKQFEFYKQTMKVQAYFAENTEYYDRVKKYQQNKLFKMYMYNFYHCKNRLLNCAIYSAMDKQYICILKYFLCKILIIK
jgi:glycosyltransferase involved in cell wall biosynthesis